MARTDIPPLNLRPIPLAAHRAGAQDRPSGRRESARARLVGRTLAVRQPLPWLCMVAVPLAITAALLSGSWGALVPLAGCAWLCTPHPWGWQWLIAVETGLLGAVWAALGADALAAWTSHRRTIGAGWALSAAAIAAIALLRRLAGRN